MPRESTSHSTTRSKESGRPKKRRKVVGQGTSANARQNKAGRRNPLRRRRPKDEARFPRHRSRSTGIAALFETHKTPHGGSTTEPKDAP
ncbi:hypothetical protein MRX96_044209 [Rhipicephalus microplus]